MVGGWTRRLTGDLKKSPVLTTTAIGFILLVLQKAAGMHFECPCYGVTYNNLSVSFFYIIPAFMSFLLMVVIKVGKISGFLDVLSTFVPSFVWWVLLMLDGRYWSCARTEWDGRYLQLDRGPVRWCEPKNLVNCTLNNGSTLARPDCMLLSQWYYVESQFIALIPLAYICGALLVYLMKTYKDLRCNCQDEEDPTSAPTPHEQLDKTDGVKEEEMKDININLDVYEVILRKKGLPPAQQGGPGGVAAVGNGAQELPPSATPPDDSTGAVNVPLLEVSSRATKPDL